MHVTDSILFNPCVSFDFDWNWLCLRKIKKGYFDHLTL